MSDKEMLLSLLENKENLTELKIVYYPNDLLHEASLPVENFDGELQDFIKNLFYTMRINNGIGIAAPQVGDMRRAVIVALDNKPIVLINPQIVERFGEVETEEGCLSLPTIFYKIKRSQKVRVVYQDENGDYNELVASDLNAVCIQHEIDHLNGKLFVDDFSKFKLGRIKNKIKKFLNKK